MYLFSIEYLFINVFIYLYYNTIKGNMFLLENGGTGKLLTIAKAILEPQR